MAWRIRTLSNAAVKWIGVGLIGLLAASASWLSQFRGPILGVLGAPVIEVISAADSGPGTLREALLTAARADRRAHIVLRVPRIVIETQLPPLANADGIIIDGGQARTEIDGSALGARPLLDIVAPGSMVLRLRLTRASGQALLVRHNGVQISDVVIEDNRVGLEVAPGVADLSVLDSTFDRNNVGLQLPGSVVRVRARNNTFRRHGRAAIWAVAASPSRGAESPLEIIDNRFADDEQSIVVIDVPTRLEGNFFNRARQSAVFVSATTAIVRANRISSAVGFGIYGDRLVHSIIANNEVDHNCAGGVMLRGAGNTRVLSNRIYSNGSGIVGVESNSLGTDTIAENLVLANKIDGIHLVGISPLLVRNRLIQNRRAGLRLSTLVERGSPIDSNPLMDGNVLRENGMDAPQHDLFQEPASPAAAPADCSWRLASNGRGGVETF